MPSKRQKKTTDARFDEQALRDMAGDKVFTRGQAYHDDGQVEIVTVDDKEVVARVMGTEIYRVQLKGAGKRFTGACSCPAFSDYGFCKHLVATALAANDLSPGASKEIGNRFARLRDYLRAQGVDVLVDRLMNLAERDPSLWQDLELAATAAGEDDRAILSRFRGAIAGAAATRRYVEYAEVGGWASGIEAVLERIKSLIANDKATLALPLLEDFFDEMEKALGEVDDSDGRGGDLVARASEIHLKACLAARPDPIKLAGSLYAREVDSDWDFFHGASEIYADVLGKDGLAEYRSLAEEAWKKIKPLHRSSRGGEDGDRYDLRFRLASILESFAERDGNLDARIAIRRKDISSAYDYLGIAELCQEHGRDGEALKWAEEGLWQFEDKPDERLTVFTANLYVRIGRKADAEKILWREFERSPSINLYKRMKVTLGDVAAVRDRAIALLQTRISKPVSRSSSRWASAADIIIQLLVYEKCFDDAWYAVERYDIGKSERMRLAETTEQSHPTRAWKVLAEHVENLVGSGGQRNYEEACRFLERIGHLRAKIGEKDAHAVWLDELALRHKAKRNFMKLLRR